MYAHIRNSNLLEGIDDPREDEQSFDAWLYLSHQPKITLPVILETHRLVTKNQLPQEHAGHIRTTTVFVGDQVMPAPWIVHELLHNWILDFNNNSPFVSPKRMHIRFENIHPFVDGNGRVGRMLMWKQELMRDTTPTLIRYEDRDSYLSWFKEKN